MLHGATKLFLWLRKASRNMLLQKLKLDLPHFSIYQRYLFMTKNITLFAIIAVGIVGLAGCSNLIEKNPVQDTTTEKPAVTAEVETKAKEETAKEVNTENGQIALYTDFTQERYSELLGKKPFAIFFYAGWCPDCVFLAEQIKKNIEKLPTETVILKANFDTESKLKQDYGITVQSTIVVIDENGKAMPTLFGPSFDELKTAISQTL